MFRGFLCAIAFVCGSVASPNYAEAATDFLAALGLTEGAVFFSDTGFALSNGGDFDFIGDNDDINNDVISGGVEAADFELSVLNTNDISENIFGTGIEIASMVDLVVVLFELEPGSAFEGLVGDLVLATLEVDAAGVDPLSLEFGFVDPDARITLANVEELSPVPLPASAALFLGALSAFVLARRRDGSGAPTC